MRDPLIFYEKKNNRKKGGDIVTCLCVNASPLLNSRNRHFLFLIYSPPPPPPPHTHILTLAFPILSPSYFLIGLKYHSLPYLLLPHPLRYPVDHPILLTTRWRSKRNRKCSHITTVPGVHKPSRRLAPETLLKRHMRLADFLWLLSFSGRCSHICRQNGCTFVADCYYEYLLKRLFGGGRREMEVWGIEGFGIALWVPKTG